MSISLSVTNISLCNLKMPCSIYFKLYTFIFFMVMVCILSGEEYQFLVSKLLEFIKKRSRNFTGCIISWKCLVGFTPHSCLQSMLEGVYTIWWNFDYFTFWNYWKFTLLKMNGFLHDSLSDGDFNVCLPFNKYLFFKQVIAMVCFQ